MTIEERMKGALILGPSKGARLNARGKYKLTLTPISSDECRQLLKNDILEAQGCCKFDSKHARRQFDITEECPSFYTEREIWVCSLCGTVLGLRKRRFRRATKTEINIHRPYYVTEAQLQSMFNDFQKERFERFRREQGSTGSLPDVARATQCK